MTNTQFKNLFKELFINKIQYIETTYYYHNHLNYRYTYFYLGSYDGLDSIFWVSKDIYDNLRKGTNFSSQKIDKQLINILTIHFNIKIKKIFSPLSLL